MIRLDKNVIAVLLPQLHFILVIIREGLEKYVTNAQNYVVA